MENNSHQHHHTISHALSSKPSCSEQRRVIDLDLNEPNIDAMPSSPLIDINLVPISQVLSFCSLKRVPFLFLFHNNKNVFFMLYATIHFSTVHP